MDHAEKAQINPESVDYNQVVSELLTISSHNITEIPGTLQSKEVIKELEPAKSNVRSIPHGPIASEYKIASFSPVEHKTKLEEVVHQLNFASYCTLVENVVDNPPDEIDTSRVAFGFGRTDSSNRYADFPLMNSRPNSAFALVNHTDEQGISRVFNNSLGYNISRPPTIQCESIKLLTLHQQDIEEKKEEMEGDKAKNGSVSVSLHNVLARDYFPNSIMFNPGHNDNSEQKN